jgi:hypothetical protein
MTEIRSQMPVVSKSYEKKLMRKKFFGLALSAMLFARPFGRSNRQKSRASSG